MRESQRDEGLDVNDIQDIKEKNKGNYKGIKRNRQMGEEK